MVELGFKKVCLQSLHFNPPLALLKDPATLPPSLLFLSLLNQILHLPPSNIPLYPTKGTFPLKRASRVGWKCPHPQTHRASPHQGGRSPHTKVGDHPTPRWEITPHQGGRSLHTKVGDHPTPRWEITPHQGGRSPHATLRRGPRFQSDSKLSPSSCSVPRQGTGGRRGGLTKRKLL